MSPPPGAPTATAARKQHRRPARRRIARSILAGVLVLALVSVAATAIWYPAALELAIFRWLPAGTLIAFVDRGHAVLTPPAARELIRRLQYVSLPPEQTDRLATAALDLHRDATRRELVEAAADLLLWVRRSARLTPEQWERFARQAVRPDWVVRERVPVGRPIAWHLVYAARAPSAQDVRWYLRCRLTELTADGQRLPAHHEALADLTGVGLIPGPGGTVTLHEPGTHTLGVRLRLEVFETTGAAPGQRIFADQATLTADVQVLDESGEEVIRPVTEPRLTDRVRQAFSLATATTNDGDVFVTLGIGRTPPPVGLAFRVTATTSAGRVANGPVILAPAGATHRTWTFGLAAELAQGSESLDLRLEPAPDVAWRDPRLADYWALPVTIEDVPIRRVLEVRPDDG